MKGDAWIVVAVLAFFVIIGIASFNSSSTPNVTSQTVSETSASSEPEEPVPPPPPPKPDLELIDYSSESGEYTWDVAGTVKNNTDKTYSYVQVEINLYDSDNAQVGSTFANMNNLEPGGVWKFKAPVFEERAKRYKIMGVTGF
jgi:hypothetical protein